jgi:hypothetical protein
MRNTLPDQAQVDRDLNDHYFNRYPHDVAEICRTFRETGYARLPGFLPQSLAMPLREEVLKMYRRHAVRREMNIPVTGNTPRRLSNVRCSDLTRDSRYIRMLYHSEPLLRFMSLVFGEACHICPYENERFMLLSESQAGDTHGWHWDDFAFSLIWMIESPPAESGGWLEFIPDTIWEKDNPDTVEKYLRSRKVEKRYHAAGDVYLLRGDTCMHRVAPLHRDTFRLVLNLAWASDSDLQRPITHETLDTLYS